MSANPTFDLLPGFLEWANGKVLESLQALDAPPEEALRWFAHVLAAEELWLARLQTRDAALPVWPRFDLDEGREWIGRNARGFAAWLDGLETVNFDSEIAYTNSQGVDHRSCVRDVLIHVIAHGTHHRGQIATAVKAAGGQPAATDYVFYARGGS
jgi:uncharacterized damage-inducible protein DinB